MATSTTSEDTKSNAPLDWVQTYGALKAGTYGDANDPTTGAYATMQRLIANNPDYDALLAKGAISKTGDSDADKAISNKSWDQAIAPTEGIDWTQLPKMGPSDYNLPANAMWTAVGGRSGVAEDPSEAVYHDPNYGDLQLSQQRAPNDLALNLMKMGAISAFAGPTGAALGGALNLGSIGTQFLTSGLKLGVNSMITGQAPNPFSILASVLKPGISTINSLLSTPGT